MYLLWKFTLRRHIVSQHLHIIRHIAGVLIIGNVENTALLTDIKRHAWMRLRLSCAAATNPARFQWVGCHQYVCFLGWLAGAGLLGPLPPPLCTLAPLRYGLPGLPALMLLCVLLLWLSCAGSF